MEKLIQKYILKLLEWQKTKLECINIGWRTSEEIKIEISLIKKCEEYLIKKWGENNGTINIRNKNK